MYQRFLSSKVKIPSSFLKNGSEKRFLSQSTEEKKAPKWLLKMAPTKGGTKPPNAMEATAIAIVAVFGYYAWFVDSGSFLVRSSDAKKEHTNDGTIMQNKES